LAKLTRELDRLRSVVDTPRPIGNPQASLPGTDVPQPEPKPAAELPPRRRKRAA
jgi:hypothetical protein